MKKLLLLLLMMAVVSVYFINSEKVCAATVVYNPDLMLLSLADVEIANEIADGDDNLFVQTLTQIGYDNYESGSSSEVEEGYEIFGFTLTADEVNLMLDYPYAVPGWLIASKTAVSKTQTLYSDASDGSIANSFQHAYWNVLMVKLIGYGLAEAYANAHENYEGNPLIHKTMDLYNNQKGRDFADNISGIFWKSNDTLATMTQTLVTDGELKYILFDYEYVSAYIYFNKQIDTVYSTADLLAYTDSIYPIYTPDYEIIDMRTNPGPIIVPMIYIDKGVEF